MAGIQARYGRPYPGGRRSFTCAEAVTGGQLVERRAGNDLVGVAAAGSQRVCGVAQHDVPAARASVQGPQVGDGHELTVLRNVYANVTFSAAAVAGDKLVATANGQVAPVAAVGTLDAADVDATRGIIGEADEDVALGAVGRALIY